jgi:pyruvate dehydrogenase E1 component
VWDFSTGSVELGVVAPLFAAAARRYVDAHFGPRPGSARFVSLAGDAELDEGNVWEAIADPSLQGLGNVMWVVDANRQSLDRVVPDQKIKRLMEIFASSGWHVVEVKYGARLREAFARPGGEALRRHIDTMSNERYQSLFALSGAALRERFLDGAPRDVAQFLAQWSDDDIGPLIQNLGGHDLRALLDAYRQCDQVTDRPSVVFAYTVKGWGTPVAGDPLNHSSLMSRAQIEQLRTAAQVTVDDEWDRFDADSPAGQLCARVGASLARAATPSLPRLTVPESVDGVVAGRATSSQEAFGRILQRLAEHRDVADHMVTTSPDVSVSTNLGGWINKMGVFHPEDQPDELGEGRLLRWKQGNTGQHIELGISEMNLFLALHALGVAHDLHGQQLLPIGTVYDPFVCRGLDALIYALYNGARFVVAGTPSGITLAPEGGAHQSSITPSIGLELPGLTYSEPAYAQALAWILCDGLNQLGDDDGTSLYLRLSTRPIDQAPFDAALARHGAETLRTHVLAGGYRLAEPTDGPAAVVLATCGAVVPEVLAAARALDDEGVPAIVLDLTSSDRLYRQWRASVRHATRNAAPTQPNHHLAALLAPAERHLPIVTAHDAASHHLAWLGSVFGTRVLPVGVDAFGQSGTVKALHEAFDLSADQIVNAALIAAGS